VTAVPAVGRTPVLVITLAGYLMIVLDISITVTALPKIRAYPGRFLRGESRRVPGDALSQFQTA
jgi:hypothetical protein